MADSKHDAYDWAELGNTFLTTILANKWLVLMILGLFGSGTQNFLQARAVTQAETQRDNVIEGTKILTQQPVVITQSDCCDELKREIQHIRATIKEWHE